VALLVPRQIIKNKEINKESSNCIVAKKLTAFCKVQIFTNGRNAILYVGAIAHHSVKFKSNHPLRKVKIIESNDLSNDRA